jgi:hypothetical protein
MNLRHKVGFLRQSRSIPCVFLSFLSYYLLSVSIYILSRFALQESRLSVSGRRTPSSVSHLRAKSSVSGTLIFSTLLTQRADKYRALTKAVTGGHPPFCWHFNYKPGQYISHPTIPQKGAIAVLALNSGAWVLHFILDLLLKRGGIQSNYVQQKRDKSPCSVVSKNGCKCKER